jgi:hypothetical protein
MKNTKKIFLYLIIAFGIIATFTPSLSQAKVYLANATTMRGFEGDKTNLEALIAMHKAAKEYSLQNLNKIEKKSESIPELLPYLPQIKEFLHTFDEIIEEIKYLDISNNEEIKSMQLKLRQNWINVFIIDCIAEKAKNMWWEIREESDAISEAELQQIKKSIQTLDVLIEQAKHLTPTLDGTYDIQMTQLQQELQKIQTPYLNSLTNIASIAAPFVAASLVTLVSYLLYKNHQQDLLDHADATQRYVQVVLDLSIPAGKSVKLATDELPYALDILCPGWR